MTGLTPSPIGQGGSGAATYEIRVAGHLDDHWAATLGNLKLLRLADGTTSLTGPVVDQAQLHGVLARVRDLGVPLLTLRTLDRVGTAGARHESQAADGVEAAPYRSDAG
jgi:hypothetical protein